MLYRIGVGEVALANVVNYGGIRGGGAGKLIIVGKKSSHAHSNKAREENKIKVMRF